MKKYKALASNSIFRIAGRQYITKEGDILELPEEHVTTRALVERGRLAEVADVPKVPDVRDADAVTAEEPAETPPPKPKTPKK